jgi:hypothetical protein
MEARCSSFISYSLGIAFGPQTLRQMGHDRVSSADEIAFHIHPFGYIKKGLFTCRSCIQLRDRSVWQSLSASGTAIYD